MICEKCGHFNEPSWALCDACSQPLKSASNDRAKASICADCGYVMTSFDVTCPRCVARRSERANEATQAEIRKHLAEREAVQATRDSVAQRQYVAESDESGAVSPAHQQATSNHPVVNVTKSTLTIEKVTLGWILCLLFLCLFVGIALSNHLVPDALTPDTTGGLKGVWQDANNNNVDTLEFRGNNSGTWNFQWVDKAPDQISFTYTADGSTLVRTSNTMDGTLIPPDTRTFTYKIDGDTLTATDVGNGVVWTFQKQEN